MLYLRDFQRLLYEEIELNIQLKYLRLRIEIGTSGARTWNCDVISNAKVH